MTTDYSHPAFHERQEERDNMVEDTIVQAFSHPVKDADVITAMKTVPRHFFVPADYQAEAYNDSALPYKANQTISQAFIVASMTALLQLSKTDTVLEVGTGSGYQTAVLAELAASVYSMEYYPELTETAEENLQALGYDNVYLHAGAANRGWPGDIVFDKILVTCAAENIPQNLLKQLRPGGKMLIPLGEKYGHQYMYIVEKTKDGRIEQTQKYAVRFVPFIGS